MPYLHIRTNVPVEEARRAPLLEQASKEVARILGKPESYVMVSLAPQTDMLFAGSNSALAYLELKSLGLPKARTKELSAALCGLMQEQLNIDPARVYIEFSDPERAMWGWNNSTF